MKTLLLMRHAKSSWKEKDVPDKERPLNKRGLRDAPRMGRLINERELIPQRILCSTAVRSTQTAELLVEVFDQPVEAIYLDSLYMADCDEYFAALRALPPEIERVMVIGHNPDLEMILQILGRRIEALPTAVVAHLILHINDWGEVNENTLGEIVEIWRPKELPDDHKREKEKAGKKK